MASVVNGHGMSAAWPWAQLCAHSLWGSSGPLPLSGLGVLIWRSVGLVLTQPAVLASQSCLPGTRATGCQPAPQPPWPHCSRSSAECASREKPCWAPQTHALWVPVSVGVVGESPGVACPPADLGPNCPPLLTFRSEPRHPGTRPPPGLLASGSLSSPRPPPPRSPLSEARRLRVLPRWSDARPSPRRPLAQEPASGMPSSPATPPPPAALPCAPSAEQAASPLHP